MTTTAAITLSYFLQVYKVYLAAIKCLHTLIVSTREAEVGDDNSWLRPILQSIFLKVSALVLLSP